MDLAGGLVEFVVGVAEAQFFKDALGSGVFRVMAGEKAFEMERAEGVGDDGLGGFGGQPFSPKLRKEVEAEFEDLLSGFIGTKAAAAGKEVVFQEEDGPVLEFVGELVGDFVGQTFEDLGFGEGATEGACDFEIAPQREGERGIIHRPGAEGEARGV